MKKIISFLLMLLALTSCSDQLNENGSSTSSDVDGLEGGGITLTISLPDFSKEELTRAGDTGLTSLNVVAYDKDGKFLSNESVTGWYIVENVKSTNGTILRKAGTDVSGVNMQARELIFM